MKIMKIIAVLGLAFTFTFTSAFAQELPEGLSVTEIFTTAGGKLEIGRGTIEGYVRKLTTANPKIKIRKVVFSVGPLPTSPLYENYRASSAKRLREGGTFPVIIRTSPEQLNQIETITVNNLLSCPEPLFLHDGVFSPSGVWSKERGDVVWVWIIAEGVDGQEVALSDLAVNFFSDERTGGGALGQGVRFGENTEYSDGAPLIKLDGSVVTSGSSQQKGRFFVVGVGFKTFGVSTEANIATVKKYVGDDWTIGVTASMEGVNSTATIGLKPAIVIPPVGQGTLTLSKTASGIQVLLTGAPGTIQDLQYTLQLSNPDWKGTGLITNGVPRVLGMNNTSAFFRTVNP